MDKEEIRKLTLKASEEHEKYSLDGMNQSSTILTNKFAAMCCGNSFMDGIAWYKKNIESQEIEQLKRENDKLNKIGKEKYTLLMYYIHSELELIKGNLEFDDRTKVENFQHKQANKNICTQIFKNTKEFWNYELSHNQMCNGINRFLQSNKENTQLKERIKELEDGIKKVEKATNKDGYNFFKELNSLFKLLTK